MSLNYPFNLYKCGLGQTYIDTEEYKHEAIRLSDYLEADRPTSKIVHFMAIGAAMEEYFNHCSSEDEPESKQYRQLFPYFLENYLDDNPGNTVKITIISPNSEFRDPDYVPFFVKRTSDKYRWEQTNMREFTSMTHNVRINLFYCPFPKYDSKETEKMSKFLKDPSVSKSAKQFLPNEADKMFTERFDQIFSEFADRISIYGGVLIAISYAVFLVGTIFESKYRNYALIRNITKHFDKKDISSRVLCEWSYRPTNYMVIPFHSSESEFIINYNDPVECKAGTQLIIHDIGDKLALRYVPSKIVISSKISKARDITINFFEEKFTFEIGRTTSKTDSLFESIIKSLDVASLTPTELRIKCAHELKDVISYDILKDYFDIYRKVSDKIEQRDLFEFYQKIMSVCEDEAPLNLDNLGLPYSITHGGYPDILFCSLYFRAIVVVIDPITKELNFLVHPGAEPVQLIFLWKYGDIYRPATLSPEKSHLLKMHLLGQ
jgi:hypothetical protein